jgi:hypothetical protein
MGAERHVWLAISYLILIPGKACWQWVFVLKVLRVLPRLRAEAGGGVAAAQPELESAFIHGATEAVEGDVTGEGGLDGASKTWRLAAALETAGGRSWRLQASNPVSSAEPINKAEKPWRSRTSGR